MVYFDFYEPNFTTAMKHWLRRTLVHSVRY